MAFAFLGAQSPDAWYEWTGSNHEVTAEGVAVARMPAPTYVSPETVIDGLSGETTVVDVALDECGVLYLLGSDGAVYTYDRRADRTTHLECLWHAARCDETVDADDASDGPTADPSAIAVTPEIIYLTDSDGGRVRAVSQRLLQTLWIIGEPFEAPVGLASHQETAYVLDRGHVSGEGFVARLAASGTAERIVTGLDAPEALVVDADGNLYVLDRRGNGNGPLAVRKFDDEREEIVDDVYPIETFVVARSSTSFEPSCLEVGDEDELLAGINPEGPAERTLFRFLPDEGTFERLPTFKRGSVALQLDRTDGAVQEGGLYVVDDSKRIVDFLVETRHYSRNPATDRYDAQVRTCLDSGELETAWHRVTASFDVRGAGSQVRLRYAATDDDAKTEDLEEIAGIGPTYADRLRSANVRWVSELVDLTAEEISDVTGTAVSTSDDWLAEARRRAVDWTSLPLPDPGDALLDDPVGRYLWVELTLLGTESRTPRVASFRAYFPRQSYLRYLPAIYQEDPASAAFLERYLSIFESVFVDIEAEIDAVTRYLDPQGVPSEYLSWLRRWLALEAGETWSEEAERRLLKRGPELFKRRGTRAGLLEMVRLFLEEPVESDESDDAEGTDDDSTLAWANAHRHERVVLRRLAAKSQLTDAEVEAALRVHETLPAVYDRAERLFLLEYAAFNCIDSEETLAAYRALLGCPQCFLLMVTPPVSDEQLRTIRRIVDDQRPAHAAGRAIELRPWIRLGSNAYLGVNSTLPERDFVLEETELGANAVLSERESGFQLGRRSRLDEDDAPLS